MKHKTQQKERKNKENRKRREGTPTLYNASTNSARSKQPPNTANTMTQAAGPALLSLTIRVTLVIRVTVWCKSLTSLATEAPEGEMTSARQVEVRFIPCWWWGRGNGNDSDSEGKNGIGIIDSW